jgi:hypothetical protein
MENKFIQLGLVGLEEIEDCPELLDFDLVLNANDEGTAYDGFELFDHENQVSVCYINFKNKTVTVNAEGRDGPTTFNYLEGEENFEDKDYWE